MNIEYCVISIIESCNLACRNCFRVGTVGAMIQNTMFPKILEVLKQLGCKYVNFSGGEPLLHQNLKEMLIYAKSSGFQCVLSTNGMLLSSLRDEILDYVDVLALPMDGFNAEINDQIRGAGHFSKVEKHVDDYMNANYPFQLKINTLVNRSNINSLDKILMRFQNNERVVWKLFQIAKRGFVNSDIDNQLTNDEFSQVVDYLRNINNYKCVIHCLQREEANQYIIIDPDLNILIATGDSYAMVANIQDKDLLQTLIQILPFQENNFSKLVLGAL